jgi:uncharacterized protein YjiS (DUF1127 family)
MANYQNLCRDRLFPTSFDAGLTIEQTDFETGTLHFGRKGEMKTGSTIDRESGQPAIHHRLIAAICSSWQTREKARRQREAVDQLRRLSDRELQDIGIRHDDIYSAVLEAETWNVQGNRPVA